MKRTRKIRLKPEGEIIATFVNPGEWFKKRWLIGVGCGFDCLFYIVEADCEGDAIDKLTDSEWGVVLKTDELCNSCESKIVYNPSDNNRAYIVREDSSGDLEITDQYGSVQEAEQAKIDTCTCSFAGNYGERVDLDDIRVLRRLT